MVNTEGLLCSTPLVGVSLLDPIASANSLIILLPLHLGNDLIFAVLPISKQIHLNNTRLCRESLSAEHNHGGGNE